MRVDELERELRAERREPDPEFARRLDDWAAAGFPRGGELDPRRRAGRTAADPAGARAGLRRRLAPVRDSFVGAMDRLRALPPRRLLAPAGAAAAFFVVAAVAISQSGGLGGDDVASSGEGAAGGGPGSAVADESGGVADQAAAPDAGAGAPPAPAEGGAPALRDARRSSEAFSPAIAPGSDVLAPIPVPPPGGGGGIAAGTQNRIVDATARITLGADADEVQGVANRVVEVTDRYDGIVSSSQVTTDRGGARASFQLEIPAKQLDAAIADLSELGDVISRTEGGQDITAQAVRARRALAETLEDIQLARERLIRTEDPAERRVIRSRIRVLDATADGLQAQLAGVKRQGRFATVAVEVTSNGASAADDSDWSLGDAADDAVSVLTAVGGILLVSLAVLVPLTALIAVAWLGFTHARRASRERALDR
jgi:hypothetical protein